MAKKRTNTPTLDHFTTLLEEFKKSMTNSVGKEKAESYSEQLFKLSDDIKINLLTELKKSLAEIAGEKHDNPFLEGKLRALGSLAENEYTDCWEALVCLGKFVCGYTSNSVNVSSINIDNFDLLACQLVAQSAIFCSQEVFNKIKEGKLGSNENKKNVKKDEKNEEGAWFHHLYRRITPEERKNLSKRRPIENGITLDDNTYANLAIKKAVLQDLKKYGIHGNNTKVFKDFWACHIWDKTCYNERYYTSVANLVLLPKSIAGLTDHCNAVKKLLQYEAWKRFGFKPKEECYYEHYHEENRTPSDSLHEPQYYNDVKWKYPIENKETTKPLRGKAKKKQ